MAAGHSWGDASRAGSNHPALNLGSATPPYPRRGVLSLTYVATYSANHGLGFPGPAPISNRNKYRMPLLGGEYLAPPVR